MKKLVVLSLAGLLAGCQQQSAPAPAPSEAASEAAPAMVTANGSPPGTYDSVAPDGTKGTSVLNADGTYQDMDASGKVTAEGTWAVKDGKTCFTPSAKDAQAQCWAESAPGPDGSFTATPEKGDALKITPATASAPPSDAASAT